MYCLNSHNEHTSLLWTDITINIKDVGSHIISYYSKCVYLGNVWFLVLIKVSHGTTWTAEEPKKGSS